MRHFTDALFKDYDFSPTVEDLQKVADKIKAEVDAHEEDGPNDNGQYYVTFWDKGEC